MLRVVCCSWLDYSTTPTAADCRVPTLSSLLAADQLLAAKKQRALLESYQEREAAAVGYMQLINPAVAITPGPLTDPKVGHSRQGDGQCAVGVNLFLVGLAHGACNAPAAGAAAGCCGP